MCETRLYYHICDSAFPQILDCEGANQFVTFSLAEAQYGLAEQLTDRTGENLNME